jgi:flavin reductase (DIM6/NTAB) family NADH-FMN oxidoreductase RutF
MEKIKIQNRPFGPFPTVLVGAEVNGKPNYVTVGACGVVSMKPVLSISLKISHYTTAGVKETGFFSINIPPVDLVQKTDYCGIVSGQTTDKSNLFTPFYDELGKAPLISECSMNFLCKVIQVIPIFDFDFFLGEIVAAYVSDHCMTDGKPDPIKINPMIMMGNNYYDLNQMVGTAFKEGAVIKANKV